MSTGHIATVTTIIHQPIDRVWQALVDPEDIRQYMKGVQVTTDWAEGSAITWKGTWNGKPFEDHGRLIAVREPEMLKYTHVRGSAGDAGPEHIVTVELKEVGGVTHLRLTQDNNATEEECAASEKTWNAMFDDLKKMLGEAPVPKPEEPRV